MKKIVALFLSMTLMLSVTACNNTGDEDKSNTSSESITSSESSTNNEETDSKSQTTEENSSDESVKEIKTLVAYFSWSSNTERMAKLISEQTGGDLYEIQPLNAYPEDYTECTEVALKERDDNARPKIKDPIASIKQYDRILIGYPIWWHTAPMIIGSFLESYDLTGVEIYPFAQSASMDKEQFNTSMEFVRKCAGSGTVHDGLFANASDTNSITKYLKDNKLIG